MKNQTTKKLLLSLVLCGLGFAAVGLFSLASRSQDEIQTEKPEPVQQGVGRGPQPPQDKIQTEKPEPVQQGVGRGPHPPEEQIEVQK